MNYKAIADEAYKKSEKLNLEFFLFTYGSIVAQMIEDNDSDEQVNVELDKFGHNIGIRLIDDFLSKTNITACQNFKETSEMIKAAFRIYLNLHPIITKFSEENKEFSIIFEETPLGDYVDLMESEHPNIYYANVLCGVIKGALEMVYLVVEAYFVTCTLRGDDVAEIKVKLKSKLNKELPPEN